MYDRQPGLSVKIDGDVRAHVHSGGFSAGQCIFLKPRKLLLFGQFLVRELTPTEM